MNNVYSQANEGLTQSTGGTPSGVVILVVVLLVLLAVFYKLFMTDSRGA